MTSLNDRRAALRIGIRLSLFVDEIESPNIPGSALLSATNVYGKRRTLIGFAAG
jgi:hypothetical protein